MSTPAGGQANNAAGPLMQLVIDVVETGRKLVEVLRWALNQWLDELAFLVVALDELEEMIERVIRDILTYVQESDIDPQAIRDLGSQWIDEVGAKASTQAAALNRAKLPSAGYWQGNAASEYYFGVVPSQAGALTTVREATDGANDALVEVANAIDSYWAGFGVALGVLAGSMVAAISLAVSKFGVALGVAGAIAGIYYFDKQVDQLKTEFGSTMNSQSNVFDKIAQFKAPFENGAWPAARGKGNILYDATVEDGTPSQWQPTNQPK